MATSAVWHFPEGLAHDRTSGITSDVFMPVAGPFGLLDTRMQLTRMPLLGLAFAMARVWRSMYTNQKLRYEVLGGWVKHKC